MKQKIDMQKYREHREQRQLNQFIKKSERDRKFSFWGTLFHILTGQWLLALLFDSDRQQENKNIELARMMKRRNKRR